MALKFLAETAESSVMRVLLGALCCLIVVHGQDSSTTRTFTFDTNGNRQLTLESSASKGSKAESVRNLNGGLSPVEKTEERVIKDDATGRMVERIIRRYDGNGQPGPPEKLQIEERKNADGSKTIETQVFKGNLSGGFSLTETTTAVARKVGNVETIDTQVLRPNLNGGIELIERKQTRIETGDKSKQEALTIERRDANGNFQTASKEVKQTKEANGATVENSAQYIANPATGQLQLNAQSVAELRKRPDGSETKQISVYGMNQPGRPNADQPQLREQQLIEKRTTNGQTVESMSVRRPSVEDPGILGPSQKVSDSICTGACK